MISSVCHAVFIIEVCTVLVFNYYYLLFKAQIVCSETGIHSQITNKLVFTQINNKLVFTDR